MRQQREFHELEVAANPGGRGIRTERSRQHRRHHVAPVLATSTGVAVREADEFIITVGDNIYGTAPRSGGPRLQLHAREVAVPLYKNRDPIKVTAPVPAHMHELLKACGWNGEDVAAATQSLNRPHAAERA